MKPFKPYLLWSWLIFLMIYIPLVLKAQTNQTINAGSQTAVVIFPVTTCIYNWVNSNPAIGLPASGTGDIAAFTAVNNTGSTISATITATPTGPSPQPPLLYIPNFDAGTVSVINANTYALITTIPVGTNPYNVMVSHDYNRVYIANQGSNTVSVIYMPTNRVLATIPGFSGIGAMAISPDNLFTYVVNTGSNTVSVISNITYTIVSTIPVGLHPIGLALSTNGSKLYVTNNNGTISIVNTADLSVTTTGPIVSNLTYIVLSPDINSSKLYVADLVLNKIDVINTADNTVAVNIPVGSRPNVIAVSPDGSRLYVANSASNNVAVINTATNTVMNNISVGSEPTGLSISEDGSLLYVTNSGNNNVSVINTTTLTVIQTFNVGARPFSVGNFYLTRADCSQPITFNITVNATGITPVITTTGNPSAVNTTYGTASSSTSFMVSGTNMTDGILVTPPAGFEVSKNGIDFSNTVIVGSSGTIASTQVYIRFKKTAAAATYTGGNIVLSSAGASDINLAMPASTVDRLKVDLTFSAERPYGTILKDTLLTTSNFNFSVFNSFLKNGETVSSIYLAFSAGKTGKDPVGYYNNALQASNMTGGNGFSPSNYIITYPPGPLSIRKAVLTLTANNVTKIFGNTITGGPGSTEFTVTGLQNGEKISSITVTYGFGAAANVSPGTYGGSVVPSNIVGSNGFLESNYTIFYSEGKIIVLSATQPIISTTGNPSAVNTTYGTASSSTSFMVSGANMSAGIVVIAPVGFEVSLNDVSFSNTVAITGTGNIPPTRVYIRLKATLAVGSYTGNVVLKSTGAADVSIAIPLSSVGRAPLPVRIIARITYGEVLNNLTLTFPDFDFSDINDYLKNGEYATALDVTVSDGNTGTNPVGIYNNAVHSLNLKGSNGFLSSNYNINYQDGEVTIIPAPIVITPTNINKPFGNTLTGGAGSTAFTVTGLQNNETINSVTITYGNGSAANALPGTYVGSVVASSPIGGNGYLPTNYAPTYTPGNIVVASAPPIITTSGTLQSLTTVYGIASSPTSFTVSGSNLTAGVTITPPAGFEVSADNLTFNSTVTIGSAGTISSAPVYIRLKATTVVGNYSGTINIQSTGATDATQTMPSSSVTPVLLTVTVENKSKLFGNPNPPLTITYTGFVNGEGASQLATQPIATTTATQSSDVGVYPITVSGGSSPNYTLSYIDGELTVYKDISIPNTFTPNGDGVNDRWTINNLSPNLTITVDIMNRNGARVYFSSGNSVSWDGYSNGVPVPFGVYYYVIKGVKEKPLTGYITVVR